ncbi:hypothetical protein [Solidesulfovibrio sp.]
MSQQRVVRVTGVAVAVAAWIVAPALVASSFRPVFAVLLALLTLCLLATRQSPASALRGPIDFLTGCLIGLAGLSLCLNTAVIAVQCWDFVVFRLGDKVIDGRELAKMAAIVRGETMYPAMTDYPYFITLYTPLYHYLGALVSLVVPDVVVAAHGLVYAAHLGLIGLLTVWMRAESGRLWPSLVLALTLVLGPYYGAYVLKTRPDLLAWLLAFSGAFLFSRHLGPGRRFSGIAWAALLLSLALLTKQQTLPILLALASAFIVRRGAFLPCLVFALLSLACTAAMYGVFFLYTDGNIVLHTVIYPWRIAADPGITNFANAVPRLADLWRAYWGLFLLFGLALAADLRHRRLHLLDWVVVVQLPFLVTLLSTWGADGNYLIGFLLTLGIRAGIFLAGAGTGRFGGPVFLAGLLLLLPGLPGDRDLLANRPKPVVLDEMAQLREIAAAGETLVNSEGSTPFVAGEQPIPVQYFDVADMAFFEEVKLFDFHASRLGHDIAEKRFDHIILSNTFVVPRYLRHIRSSYVPARTLGEYTLYQPRPGRRITIPDLGQASAGGDVRLAVEAMDNMEFGEGFGARHAGSLSKAAAGRITLRLASAQPMDTVALDYYPKVHPVAEGNAVVIEWSPDGVAFAPLARYAGMGNDTATDLFSPALTATFSPGTTTAYIRLTLQGTASVWSSTTTPMTITIKSPGTQ